MSGHDALDELYERLRGAEDAQHARRAGGITPEAIRAARGGVVDGYGRECHVVDENAADGDSEPLAGIPRDSRERIEADLLALTKSWHDHDGDFMKLYSSVAYAQVKELLDRQAALTEREYMERSGISELRREVDELRAELDEYGETHMRLPVDADGVPIRVGDELRGYGLPDGGAIVKALNGTMVIVGRLEGGENYAKSGLLWSASETRHVKPRTIEDVLKAFFHDALDANAFCTVRFDDVLAKYAEEIRELMEVRDD